MVSFVHNGFPCLSSEGVLRRKYSDHSRRLNIRELPLALIYFSEADITTCVLSVQTLPNSYRVTVWGSYKGTLVALVGFKI